MLSLGLRALIILLSINLLSCGFHLRGFIDLPSWLRNVSVINNTHDQELKNIVATRLKSNNITTLPCPEDADIHLVLLNEEFRQDISSVSSASSPRQYQLSYKLCFSVVKKDGTIIVPPTKINVSRQITINNNRILGSDNEEAITKREIKNNAVTQLLSRISRV